MDGGALGTCVEWWITTGYREAVSHQMFANFLSEGAHLILI